MSEMRWKLLIVLQALYVVLIDLDIYQLYINCQSFFFFLFQNDQQNTSNDVSEIKTIC